MKRDRNAMIHWWYTPDSYDVWVPDVSPDLEIDTPQHSGALEVSVAGEYRTVCCVISPPKWGVSLVNKCCFRGHMSHDPLCADNC